MSAPSHWGKRPRDEGGDGASSFVRFSELSPEKKAERRKQERAEKKSRERTMAYFQSVQRMLEEHAQGRGDPSALAGIVDSVFVELIKLLHADPTFHLLRNGTVCRVIEAALGNAMLLHSKSLLYLFLGRIMELITSPVASYMMETLVASISQALSALAEDSEKLDAEMADEGPGIHTGSGLPSSATVLRAMVDELAEHAESLLVHEVGSRAVRSVILVLGGFPIRNAPMPEHPIAFPDLLGVLDEAMVKGLEAGYGREYSTASAVEAWMAAVQTPTTSFIVQSLLRVSEEGSRADCAVRQRLEGLSYKGEPLLRVLLEDPLGSHVVQAYIKAPAPLHVIEAGDRIAQAQSSTSGQTKAADAMLRAIGVNAEPQAGEGAATVDDLARLHPCCWTRALQIVSDSLERMLAPGSEHVQQAGFVLKDLALYTPTAAHLMLLWERVMSPRLELFLDISALAGALVSFTRKCAFSESDSAEDDNDAATTGIPLDINEQLKKDEAQNVRYFAVSVAFQKAVCTQICKLTKARCTKGAAQYFLVETTMGDAGSAVARCLLHFHPSASAMLQNSLDKVRVDDMVRVAQSRAGSLALQQFLRASASRGGGVREGTGAAAEETEASLRMLRRLKDHLGVLCGDKHGAFVVETLYDVSSVAVKEQLVKVLVPLYEGLREEAQAKMEAEEIGDDPSAEAERERRFVARKVFTKCCVEQYVHRPDDWRALAQRQYQVQKLLRRMMLES